MIPWVLDDTYIWCRTKSIQNWTNGGCRRSNRYIPWILTTYKPFEALFTTYSIRGLICLICGNERMNLESPMSGLHMAISEITASGAVDLKSIFAPWHSSRTLIVSEKEWFEAKKFEWRFIITRKTVCLWTRCFSNCSQEVCIWYAKYKKEWYQYTG